MPVQSSDGGWSVTAAGRGRRPAGVSSAAAAGTPAPVGESRTGTDLPVTQQGPQGATARRRLAVAVAVGAVAAAAAAFLLEWDLVPLIGWDAAAIVLISWVWLIVARSNAEETAERAVVDDPSTAWTDLLLLAAAVASLAAVGLVLARTNGGGDMVGRVALGVLSVVLSWGLVHTIFTLRYARLYYTGTDGGVDFNQDDPPDYLDFGYLAFTIGMTFQVSDTDLQISAIRHVALRHALLSYLFGAVIIAGTINLIAGLTK
jgi:uncharacterized membrane protein